jgi:hypothetical protein
MKYRRVLLALSWSLFGPHAVPAHGQAATKTFEVASVKPNASGSTQTTIDEQHGYLVSEDDDFEVLRSGRTETQEEQLQDALKRDVKNGQNHGTSDDTTRGPLFYADRINAPHRHSTLRQGRICLRHVAINAVLATTSRPAITPRWATARY